MIKVKDKLIFIGGRDRGLECLKFLTKKGVNVAAIFCMKEDDHEYEKYYKQVEKLANRKKIPIKITNSVKTEENIQLIRKLNPVLILVMGWRTLIPKEILDVPKKGAVAVHESLLPKYRGFAPVNWAVINGEEATGVTLFYMNEGMDSGEIIDQKIIHIGVNDTAHQIYQKTKKASVDLIAQHIESLMKGKTLRLPQNDDEATYTCPRIPEDGMINWNCTANEIHNLIRGLSFPYPGAFTLYKGKRLFIQKAILTPNHRDFVGSIPGRVVALGNGWIEVLAGDRRVLRIEKVQEEGGEIIDASVLIKSIKTTLGR